MCMDRSLEDENQMDRGDLFGELSFGFSDLEDYVPREFHLVI